MISSINFKGNVFLAGSTKHLSPKKEVREMKKFADKQDCDVVVLDRDYYEGGVGVYSTLLVKEDEHTGNNLFAKKEFNFKNPIDAEEVTFNYEI